MALKLSEEQKKNILKPGGYSEEEDLFFLAQSEQEQDPMSRHGEGVEKLDLQEETPKQEDEGPENGEHKESREVGDYQTIIDFNQNESEWDKDRDRNNYMDHVTAAVDVYRAAMTQETWLPEQGLKLDRAEIRSLAKNQGATVINACEEYEANVKPWTPRGHRKMAAVQLLKKSVEKQSRLMADDLSEYVLSDEAIQNGAVSYEEMVMAVQEGHIRSVVREEAVRLVEEESTDMSADDDGRRKRTGRQLRQEQLFSTDEENKLNTQERKNRSDNVKKDQHRFSNLASCLGKDGATILPFNTRTATAEDGLASREGISEFSEYTRMMGENKAGFELRMSDKALNQINTIRMLGLIAGVDDYKNLAKNENLLFKYHKRGRRIAVESVVLKDPPSATGAYHGFLSKPEFESFVDDLKIDQGIGENLKDVLRQLDERLSPDMKARDPNVRKKIHRLFAALTIWLRSGRNADKIPDRIFN